MYGGRRIIQQSRPRSNSSGHDLFKRARRIWELILCRCIGQFESKMAAFRPLKRPRLGQPDVYPQDSKQREVISACYNAVVKTWRYLIWLCAIYRMNLRRRMSKRDSTIGPLVQSRWRWVSLDEIISFASAFWRNKQLISWHLFQYPSAKDIISNVPLSKVGLICYSILGTWMVHGHIAPTVYVVSLLGWVKFVSIIFSSLICLILIKKQGTTTECGTI